VHDLTCDEVRDAAPPFALDILEPSERADVAAHLVRCPTCRQEVTAMQESATRLLDLDYYYQSDGDGQLRPGRKRLRLVLTLAAVAVLLVGTTLGPTIGAAGRDAPVAQATAALLQTNQAVGTINFYASHKPAVELAVRGLVAKGWLRCVLVDVDGRAVALGSFKLYEGSGYWGTTTRVDPARVASFELIDTSGRLVASAVVS